MVNSYLAQSLHEALELRANMDLTPYCGGTDLMIHPKADAAYLFVHAVPEMKKISDYGDSVGIGAACSFTEILESDLAPALLKQAVSEIAAPAIRNLGSVGGNIANASPKADSALVFFASDAKLRLASLRGERILPIEEFYLGRNKTALERDELIVEVLMPKSGDSYYQKVGARNALAIARVSFAAVVRVENGRIEHLATAFGAIGDVILRRKDIDAMLIGKTIAEAQALKADYLKAYDEAIQPIPGRVSAEYRKDVCMNLLEDFFDSKIK